ADEPAAAQPPAAEPVAIGPVAGPEPGPEPAPEPTASADVGAWSVDGGVATFTVADGQELDATLVFDADSAQLSLVLDSGEVLVLDLDVITGVLIQGSGGSDALAIDESVAAMTA